MNWIRPLITIIAICGLTVGFFLKMISAEVYAPIVTMTIIYWFKSRDEAKNK
jgi:hypothetical protein